MENNNLRKKKRREVNPQDPGWKGYKEKTEVHRRSAEIDINTEKGGGNLLFPQLLAHKRREKG